MRFLVCFVVLALVALAAAMPADIEVQEVPQSLYDVDVQGHENTGEREARQYYGGGYPGGYGGGGYGRYPGGFGGGYGGYPGGYGGGYGGYGGGHHHHHHGGHRGGYYG